MSDHDIKIEFGKQAKKFRLHFGLSQIEVADLSDMSPSEYSDLENGTTNYNVEKLQIVSSIYGLFYYQMGNPKCKFPALSKLPERTRAKINSREKPLKVYNERLIVEHLTVIFGTMSEKTAFLIRDISDKIIEQFGISYDSEEISGTISKNFSDSIVKTDRKQFDKKGRGAKPFYFMVVKSLSDDVVKKAVQTIEKYKLKN
ncbi:helix-turn-helix domain-containing protein [Sphingobacterium multivorum]|uniref:helix-turn-helix domain-containing protein n=1 Tax=Sphingobacterium multivorum TaxID=28454 RepID=UPI0028A9AEF5|nr:helix-turn-helix transcriptional regulator [Sphingobacterium multivorum]